MQTDGVTPETDVFAFDPANTGRPQLTVRGVPAWDALAAFVQFGIRTPISPLPDSDPDVLAGRALFQPANCRQCHNGPQWTSSRVRFTPPPGAGLVVNGQIISELRNVGTFDPVAVNEVNANGAAPLGRDGRCGHALEPGGSGEGGTLSRVDRRGDGADQLSCS